MKTRFYKSRDVVKLKMVSSSTAGSISSAKLTAFTVASSPAASLSTGSLVLILRPSVLPAKQRPAYIQFQIFLPSGSDSRRVQTSSPDLDCM